MNDNTNIIFKAVLFIILLIAIYKVLQKIGIFDDADDKAQKKLIEDKGGLMDPLTKEEIKKYAKYLLPVNAATSIAGDIYFADGIIDEDQKALAAIKRIKNKLQLRQIATIFSYMQKDLAKYLDFLNDENMSLALKYIKKLPAK